MRGKIHRREDRRGEGEEEDGEKCLGCSGLVMMREMDG